MRPWNSWDYVAKISCLSPEKKLKILLRNEPFSGVTVLKDKGTEIHFYVLAASLKSKYNKYNSLISQEIKDCLLMLKGK